MITNEYRFHIYAKDKCLYSSLTNEEFRETWETLKGMVGLMKTDYKESDLNYEKVKLVKSSEESSY